MLKQIGENSPTVRAVISRTQNRPIAVAPRLKLKNYMLKTMPVPPEACGYTKLAQPETHQMYGNDIYGDCVEAAVAHLIGIFGAQNQARWIFSPEQIIEIYSAMGGYVPGDPSTDNGTDIGTALSIWQKPGVPGPGGTHLIQGSLAVDATNPEEYRTALWLFENLILGAGTPRRVGKPLSV